MSNSLLSLKKAAVGEILMTEQLEEISDSLLDGLIPKYWKSVALDTEKSLDSWVAHFSLRLEQSLVWIQ
jgi:dynein heavy chain